MAENATEDEIQNEPNDLDLVNYYQKRAVDALNNVNSSRSNFEQTSQDDFAQNSNQIEIQLNQHQNQHPQSTSNDLHQNQQSNQNFPQPLNSIIFQSSNIILTPNSHQERKLIQNIQSNIREEVTNTNSIAANNQQTNTNIPYLLPNYQHTDNIQLPNPYTSSPYQLTSTPQDLIDENIYNSNPNHLNSIPIEHVPRHLPPYVSATPRLLADIDNYSVEAVVNGCGENVPWTDLFFHLIGKGVQSKFHQTEPKLENLIDLFTKKAQEVGEELIDAYIDGNFDYLEKFRVDVGGIAGGRKYLKSNILFKFSIDAHRIYRDNRNSMKVASQELRVINHLVNEKSLNKLFVLPCLALITKCGLRMYASSLLPLNPKESLKYGCEDLKQSNRIIKKDDATMNNIFNLISQTLNLKSHSIAGDKNNNEIICADIEGHLGTDRNYYLVDTTRLFPPESPFNNSNSNQSNEHLFTFLRPELVRRSSNPLNNDSFSVFWNGSENQRKEDEGNIQKLSDSIYSTLIPELSHSIQQRRINLKGCDDVKHTLHSNMLCLRHLPYLIQNILADLSNLSNEAMKSLNFLLIEMFSRILKWKWYSLRGTENQKQSQTTEMMNQYFSESSKERISNWIQLLNQYFSIRTLRLDSSQKLSHQCSQFLEDLFHEISIRFSELCGIEFKDNNNKIECKFKSIVKSINLPKPKSLEELIELKNEQESKFGKDSLILASTLLDIARFHQYISKQPNHIESSRFYEECLRIYELHGKQDDWQTLSIQLEIIEIKEWHTESLQNCHSIKEKMEKTIGKQHPHYATIRFLIGRVLLKQGKYEESLKYHEDCLEIQKQTIGKQHPDYATTLISIGLVLFYEGKFEESLKYLDLCLKIQEQTIGKQHPNYAQTLNVVGINLEEQSKNEEALKYYDQCLKIYEQTIGKQHPKYAITLYNVGNNFQDKGKFEESLKYFEECLKIQEQTIGKQHPKHATTLKNIALILTPRNNSNFSSG